MVFEVVYVGIKMGKKIEYVVVTIKIEEKYVGGVASPTRPVHKFAMPKAPPKCIQYV